MRKGIILVLLVMVFMGCVPAIHTSVLQNISIGMTKKQVIEQMGNPKLVRGSIVNSFGQTIEVWEYLLSSSNVQIWELEGGGGMYSDLYWLYFCNGKLVQWGKAGDWQKEADRIYEIRFR